MSEGNPLREPIKLTSSKRAVARFDTALHPINWADFGGRSDIPETLRILGKVRDGNLSSPHVAAIPLIEYTLLGGDSAPPGAEAANWVPSILCSRQYHKPQRYALVWVRSDLCEDHNFDVPDVLIELERSLAGLPGVLSDEDVERAAEKLEEFEDWLDGAYGDEVEFLYGERV